MNFLNNVDNVLLGCLLCLHMATTVTGGNMADYLSQTPNPYGTVGGIPSYATPAPVESSVPYGPAIVGAGPAVSTQEQASVSPPNTSTPPPTNTAPPPTNTQPSGAPPYASNTENQTVSYNGQTFKSDGKGGWVLQNTPSGPSESDLNAVFEPTMNYLNQAESQIRSDYPSVLDAAQKQYEAAIAELTANKTKNAATISENAQTAQNRKEDALSAARRLYDELRRGYGQRFGGASSAGQAASEIANVEQMRQMGQTGRDFNTTMRQIDQQKVQLEQDYQTQQASLVAQKAQALSQAQQNFTQQLNQIQAQRAQTESQKAAAKLDALNQLKAQAYQIQQQAATYQQNLDAMYKQSQLDLQTYAQKLALAGQGSTTAINSFLNKTTTNPSSGLQVGGSQGMTTNPQYTGSIKKTEEQPTGFAKLPGTNQNIYDPYGLYQQSY